MNPIEREIYIDNKIMDLSNKIRYLDSSEITVIENLCRMYDEMLMEIKGIDFKYEIFVSNEFDIIYVFYMDNGLKVEPSSNFVEIIAEWLVDSVETWLNLDIAETHLNIILKIFEKNVDVLNEDYGV